MPHRGMTETSGGSSGGFVRYASVSHPIEREATGSQGNPVRPAQGDEPHGLSRSGLPRAAEAARPHRLDRPYGRQHRPHRGDQERQIPVAFGPVVRCSSGHGVQGRGDRLEIPHAQSQAGRHRPQRQEFQDGDDRAGRAGGLAGAHSQHERDRRSADGDADARRRPPLHHLHQRRSSFRLRQGRPHRAGHPDRVRHQRSAHLVNRSSRSQIQPAAPRARGAARAERQIHRLFG